jgi:hypothetical protein
VERPLSWLANCSGEQRHYDMIQIKLVDRTGGPVQWRTRSRGHGLNWSVAGILPVGHVGEPLVLIGNS